MLSAILAAGLAVGAVYALIGITYNIMFAASRVMSFTAGQLGTLGGVLGALFINRLGLPIIPGFILALANCAAIGVVTEIVAVRPVLKALDQHLYVLSTLGFALMIQTFTAIEWSTEPQPFPRLLGIGALDRAGAVRRPGPERPAPREAARRGLVHVTEGHRVFTQLSVTDNLLLAGYGPPRAARVDEALSHFLEVAAKRAGRAGALSGGQQQMLAVAQGLVRRPRLPMLDEPSAGLSPVLVDRVLAVMDALRQQGTAVLLVEQLIEKALRLADRVYALAQGRIVLQASTAEADLPHRLEQAYFGQDAVAPLEAGR